MPGHADDWIPNEYEPGLVSVIIPTYNRAHFLPATLYSVRNQTYRPLEVIVVDDGSTDETWNVLTDWKAEHETGDFRLRLLHQENQGAPVARNRGVQHSRGEYIQFLDSDDLLSEEKVEIQVEELASRGAPLTAVTFCETIFFESGTDPEKGERHGGRLMSSSTEPVKWLTDLLGWDGQKGMVAPHAWLTPRNVVKDAGPWRRGLTVDQDGEYFARIVLASTEILKTNGVAFHRRHEGEERQGRRESVEDYRSQLVATKLKEEQLLKSGQPEYQNRIKEFAARQYMRVAYRTFPAYPSLSAVAEQWAIRCKVNVDPPPSRSLRASFLRGLLGWRGHRILSHIHHNLVNNFYRNRPSS